MKVTNKSNYPRIVEGVRIEPYETEEVDLDQPEKLESDDRLVVEEDDNVEDDVQESKPVEKEEKGDN